MATPLFLTDADADRLMLLSRHVHSPRDGEHLMHLEEKVANAQVCESEEIPPDVVTMNSRVRVLFEDTGDSAEYTLVFPSGANARRQRVSVLGSLGRALLGARTGDTIEFETAAGPRRCRVEAVLFQPEAAGDFSA